MCTLYGFTRKEKMHAKTVPCQTQENTANASFASNPAKIKHKGRFFITLIN